MRAAVYTGTRNLYQYMIISAKSLLMHSNVEKIYFLIQDDIFPYEIPQIIECINIKQQQYFKHDGPNYKSRFTYMALIRGALTKIFPNLDTILSLDVDVIINENISELWDLDLTNYYLAAVQESLKYNRTNYINAGVMLLNLKKLRQENIDNIIINALNTQYFKFDVQDCYSKYCYQKTLILPADYNFNEYTDYQLAKNRKIIHYAGINIKNWSKFPIIKKYNNISFQNIQRNIHSTNKLDIIIPSYNDQYGLLTTLKSLYYKEFNNWINITIVDDNSVINYKNILQQFPNVKILYLKDNGGPGKARAEGIKATYNDFITFIDCGDIIISKYALLEIQDTLLNHNIYDIYKWPWIYDDTKKLISTQNTSTPGKIYRREFLQIHNIYPCSTKQGSYAAQDCSFNSLCDAIVDEYSIYSDIPLILNKRLPIYQVIVNEDSLTRKNNKAFFYDVIPAMIENGNYLISEFQRLNLTTTTILPFINAYMINIYQRFLACMKKDSYQYMLNWNLIYNFYHQYYSKYENLKENKNKLSQIYFQRLSSIKRYTDRPNIQRFLLDLKENKICPEHYLTS